MNAIPTSYKFLVTLKSNWSYDISNLVICDTLEDAERVRNNLVNQGYDLRNLDIDEVAYIPKGEVDNE